MAKSRQKQTPPRLSTSLAGEIDTASLADLLEWFLRFDERVSIVRHPQVEELFRWKQEDERSKGADVYPFENAEARFAVGIFQAIAANNTKETLQRWITDVLQALGESKQNNEDVAKGYRLDQGNSHVEEAKKLPSDEERRFYLTNCWIESLSTAEVRFLGWVFEDIYGEPFQPLAD